MCHCMYHPACVPSFNDGCSTIEYQIEKLTKLANELTKRQQEREATAQEYRRYVLLVLHACGHVMVCLWIVHPPCMCVLPPV